MNSASGEAAQPRRTARGTVIAVLLLLTAISGYLQLRAAVETQVVQPVRADALDYFAGAHNLWKFGIYSRTWSRDGTPPAPDAVRTPGYSLLLLPLFTDKDLVIGDLVRRAMVLQALLAMLLVPMTWLLARRVVPDPLALAPAALVAITPQLVTASTYLLSEVPFAVAMTAALLALVGCVVRRDLRWLPLVAGLLLGAAALIRPTVQFLPLFVAIFFLMVRDRRAAGLVVLGFALPFGAWMARNVIATGSVSDSTITIGTIHHGSYPRFMYRDDPRSYGFPYAADPRSAEITRSMASVAAHVAHEFRERPLRMVTWYLLEKPFYLVAWEPIQGAGDVFIYQVAQSPYHARPEFIASKLLVRTFHWPLMLLGYLGAILAWLPVTARVLGETGARAARLLSLVLAYVVAIHIVGAPFPRYSVPFRPLQYVLATTAVLTLVHAYRLRRPA